MNAAVQQSSGVVSRSAALALLAVVVTGCASYGSHYGGDGVYYGKSYGSGHSYYGGHGGYRAYGYPYYRHRSFYSFNHFFFSPHRYVFTPYRHPHYRSGGHHGHRAGPHHRTRHPVTRAREPSNRGGGRAVDELRRIAPRRATVARDTGSRGGMLRTRATETRSSAAVTDRRTARDALRSQRRSAPAARPTPRAKPMPARTPRKSATGRMPGTARQTHRR